MNILQENVEKAHQSLEFVCNDLRVALSKTDADAVQAIVMLQLIEDANKLRIKTKNFLDAIT